MFDFFIDTADIDYIKEKWTLLKPHTNSSYFLGITTNPAVFAKENLNSLEEWETRTRLLAKLVTDIKGPGGVIYVQMPSDDLTEQQVFDWAELILDWGDGETGIGIKIPPYKKYLDLAYDLDKLISVNVTGISDCGTALAVDNKSIDFLSVIPGRMVQKGILNTNEQVRFVTSHVRHTGVIAGSARTLEGVCECVEFGCVPTIGKRVLDLVTKENAFTLAGMSKQRLPTIDFCPTITNQSKELSEDFFKEMNGFGSQVKKQFFL